MTTQSALSQTTAPPERSTTLKPILNSPVHAINLSHFSDPPEGDVPTTHDIQSSGPLNSPNNLTKSSTSVKDRSDDVFKGYIDVKKSNIVTANDVVKSYEDVEKSSIVTADVTVVASQAPGHEYTNASIEPFDNNSGFFAQQRVR